jgi:hypothetical protein
MDKLTDIKTGQDFVDFMEMVWDIRCKSTVDGGVELTESPLFEAYQNARTVLEILGARKGKQAYIGGRRDCSIWTLPSGDKVRVLTDGSAVSLAK